MEKIDPSTPPPQRLSPCHRRILRVDIDDQLSISKSVPNLSSKRQHSVNYRYSGKRKMHEYFMKKKIFYVHPVRRLNLYYEITLNPTLKKSELTIVISFLSDLKI